ncbi:hypothetical protein LAZ40_09335 [Cereibacter sphaeroides]|uniref:hypothetical protein n=1 Tax=Cereibacter sphaeroides TaxID=1063 RepID=UPI001F341A48|nr:hypothetical protein [Cereibacter sphaeroides]MCE6959254.1 hypothetical protein [Cereibacter sphaeroides]MCE6971248.1 hypothetical protein [Cereibacter sphaeroides]
MARRKREPHEIVEFEFDQLKRLVHNMLTGSKNLFGTTDQPGHYLREYPRTYQYVLGPLKSAEEFILERLDGARGLCSDMARLEPEEKDVLQAAEDLKLTGDHIRRMHTLITAAWDDEQLGRRFRELAGQHGFPGAASSAPSDIERAGEARPIRLWMSGPAQAVLMGAFDHGPVSSKKAAEQGMKEGDVLVCKEAARISGGSLMEVIDETGQWTGEPKVTGAWIKLNGVVEELVIDEDGHDLNFAITSRLERQAADMRRAERIADRDLAAIDSCHDRSRASDTEPVDPDDQALDQMF